MKDSNVCKRVLRYVPVLALIGASGAWAQSMGPAICGQIGGRGQAGPFDYRSAPRENISLVEGAHFTSEVQMLQRGHAGYLGQDIDYTLRAIPNNPRALLAMTRYAARSKTERPQGASFPVECYFERAARFTPDDPMPHVIYAIYLRERNRSAEATSQLEQAEALRGEPSNFDLDYNIGLVYFDLGLYDKSLAAATRAYELGAPLPALRSKLKAKGKWRDPPPVAVSAPAPVAAEPPSPAVQAEAPAR